MLRSVQALLQDSNTQERTVMAPSKTTIRQWTFHRTEDQLFKFDFKDQQYDCCFLDGVYHIKRAGQNAVFTRFTGNEYIEGINGIIDYKETSVADDNPDKATIRNLCNAVEQLRRVTKIISSGNMFDHVREPLAARLNTARQNLDEAFKREGFR